MSRVALVLAAAAAMAATPVFAAPAPEPQVNAFGIPLAPQGGNASIHQWGGVDDQFAVTPDGDEAPAAKSPANSPLAKNQGDSDADADANDPGDPDSDHSGEILPI